jgi:RecB family exonuclease
MAFAPATQITSWSFSRYNDYRTCPLKARFKHVDKLKEPKNDAMQRGIDIHKLAETYIKGELSTIPPELKKFTDMFKDLRKAAKRKVLPAKVENSLALKRDWTETVWNDWNHCWLRVNTDAENYDGPETIKLYDWKTGKPSSYKVDEYMEQLELYALAAMVMYPWVAQVTVKLVFLDTGDVFPSADTPVVFTRADIPRLKKLWEKRVKPMLTDTVFKPTPNSLCKYCHFRKSNGGPCPVDL